MISALEAAVVEEIRGRVKSGEVTMTGLAGAAGVSRSAVQGLLRGASRGSAELLSSVAAAAGLEWSDLVHLVRGQELLDRELKDGTIRVGVRGKGNGYMRRNARRH